MNKQKQIILRSVLGVDKHSHTHLCVVCGGFCATWVELSSAHLRDIAGSVPDHCNKVNIALKRVT